MQEEKRLVLLLVLRYSEVPVHLYLQNLNGIKDLKQRDVTQPRQTPE